MASASASASRRTASTLAAQTVFPDEILEEIFVRLDAAADVVRVSATCTSFRRIVTARRFILRFQSLHSPPVLGFLRYGHREFLPVGPPHPSAPEAGALVQAADFTFSFLPDTGAWRTRDARDGRVLLSRRISAATALEDLLVCDPLYRRYVKIPRVPDSILQASTPDNIMALDVDHILAPAGEDDEEESFRVICTMQHIGKVVVFVFSSCKQTWRGITSTICLPNEFIGYTHYANGCLYWMVGLMALMLDTSEMKFSIIDLPPHNFHSMRAIVEAADGRLGFLALGDDTVDLYCKNQQSNGVGAQEWLHLHNKLIPLPKQSGINCDFWETEGTAGWYLTLVAHGTCNKFPSNAEHFVLDIKTLLVEKLCTSNNGFNYGVPYARFPPPLSLPSI